MWLVYVLSVLWCVLKPLQQFSIWFFLSYFWMIHIAFPYNIFFLYWIYFVRNDFRMCFRCILFIYFYCLNGMRAMYRKCCKIIQFEHTLWWKYCWINEKAVWMLLPIPKHKYFQIFNSKKILFVKYATEGVSETFVCANCEHLMLWKSLNLKLK